MSTRNTPYTQRHESRSVGTNGTKPETATIIPVLNEAAAIGTVIDAIPAGWRHDVIVVDNGSTDGTPEAAAAHGAEVVYEPRRGYGSACLAGIARLASRPAPPDIVVFIDGDASDYPEEMPRLVAPIAAGSADLVIGSRALLASSRAALLPQARFGNRLATSLINLFWWFPYSDLGPFRAITWTALQRLGMRDRTFGWTVEMQVRALKRGLRVAEVPVSYRQRIGTSKITGTVKGSVMAGWMIIATIFSERFGRTT
ncbi:MAG: glycosyltransferase family 2 protein [Deltaproteobacteria bacterium]|nr:glycosyltransferase family 2 protein [Candidatus Anaeroferrophillacea bacterium]